MTGPASPSLDEAYLRSERVVCRKIADEYILVPIVGRGADADSIFNLNRVGAFIWEALDGRRSGAEVVAGLVGRFEVEPARARADYLEFVSQLLSIRVVERVEAAKRS